MADDTGSSSSGGIKGALTRKIGPLPTWGWVLILALLIIGWAWYKNRTSASTASPSGSSDVPEFVNQVYTGTEPPAAPEPKPKKKGSTKDEKPPADKKPKEPKPRHRGHKSDKDDTSGQPEQGTGAMPTTTDTRATPVDAHSRHREMARAA